MALTIVLSPGCVKTMSAAARAASVAPSTAMPMSARFSAGASFTPSPVTAAAAGVSDAEEPLRAAGGWRTSHRVASPPQRFHDEVFVFGENLRETVCRLYVGDVAGQIRRRLAIRPQHWQVRGQHDVRAQPQLAGHLSRDTYLRMRC